MLSEASPRLSASSSAAPRTRSLVSGALPLALRSVPGCIFLLDNLTPYG